MCNAMFRLKNTGRRGRHGSIIATALVILTCTTLKSPGQGCIASRGTGMCLVHTGLHLGEDLPPESGFQVSAAYRYFQSDRHFRGDHEEANRQEEGSQVINNSNFIDLGITYAFNPRYSVSLTVPFVVHNRSQVVRDPARNILGRYDTQSSGLADVRLIGNTWLLDPVQPRKANVLFGVGVDIPTGEKDVRDTFQVFDSGSGQILGEERTVDQSIQPGDGGWGLALDLYSYWQIQPRLNGFINGSYTVTPEVTSGVPTYRGRNPFEAEMSIGYSYLGRAGLEYALWPKHGLTLSLAGRIDGVPARDVIGDSDGFRRPGYAVSIEPGVSAMIDTWYFNAYMPVAIYRNRVQSVPDKQFTETTGTYQHGDAAFADLVFMFSVSKSF